MALTTLPSIDYSARDFTSIRAALIDHVKLNFPNDWQDYTESNLGICILELVAYVGDQLSFYLDRVSNEMFLPTVTQRQNAINLAALVGYVPRTTAAGSAPIRITLVSQSDATVIPAYTIFSDKNGEPWEFLVNIEIPAGRTDTKDIEVIGEVLGAGDGTTTTYSFLTDNANLVKGSVQLSFTINAVLYTTTVKSDGTVTVPFGGSGTLDHETGQVNLLFKTGFEPDSSTNITITYDWNQKITAFQGKTRLEQFTSDATSQQQFILSSTPVLISPRVESEVISPNPNRFEVWVGDPGSPFGNATGTKWTRVDSLVSAGPTEQVYSVKFDDQDRAIIEFGDNLAGAIPPSGTINVIYRTGGGTKGNIAVGFIDTTVTGQAGLLAVTTTITNFEKGSGGAERESLDEIRVNTPAFLRTNDTATTEQDYDSLSLFSRSGIGAITRAKSRLTPLKTITTRTVHSSYIMGTVPVGAPTTYFLLLPATPAIISTVAVSYTVAGVVRTVTANDLGSGLADLSGDATVNQASTRLRYNQQDFSQEVPGGFSGNGSQISFSGTLLGFPVFPSSVLFHYKIAGVEYVGYDDGAGFLNGTNVNSSASTINYTTGAVVLTFGTSGSRTSQNSQNYNFNAINAGGDVTLQIKVDGGGTQTITFTSGDFASYAACTAQEVVNKINASLTGALASVSSNKVKITSNTFGSTSSIEIVGGTANHATLGLNFQLGVASGVSSPPENASVISFDYQSCLKLVLNNAPTEGSDILISMESGPTSTDFPTNNIEVYTWTTDSDGKFVPPNTSLRDNLKSFLDLRRVLGTSVQVLAGFTMKIHYYLTVTFDPAVDQTQTRANIVSLIGTAFSESVNVAAGQDVPLSLVYDALTPLPLGVKDVVVQDVAVRVPIATGDGVSAVFKNDANLTPGKHVASGKLPALTGTGKIRVFLNDTQIGTSDSSTPAANLTNVTGASHSVLSGSTFNKTTGAFTIKISPAPSVGDILSVDYFLDEQVSSIGNALWNVTVESWEIAEVGDIFINNVESN